MARIFMTGFDLTTYWSPITTNRTSLDFYNTTTNFNQASVKRTGARALSFTTSSLNVTHASTQLFTTNDWFFFFAYRKSGNASSALFDIRSASGGVPDGAMAGVHINSSGQVFAYAGYNTAQKTSDSDVLNNDEWYLIELRFRSGGNGVSGQQTVELKVNDVVVGSYTTGSSYTITAGKVCWLSFTGGSGVSTYFDDFIWQDSTGSYNNTWVKNERVILLSPASDAQAGSWLIADGTTNNMYDAVNNMPVANTPSAASDTNRIESIDSSGDNATDEVRFSPLGLIAAGIKAKSVITACLPWVLCGEEAGTGTKSISFGTYDAVSTYYLTSVSDVTDGNSGAVAGYPTQWFWYPGTMIEPEFTVLNSTDANPVMQLVLRKTDAGTRSATVGFVGVYVSFREFFAFPNFNPAAQMVPLLCT